MSSRHVTSTHAPSSRLRLVAVVVATYLFPSLMWPQSASTPSPGEPEVFHIYLRQVHRAVESLKQPNAGNSAEGAAARLGVSPADLPVINSAYETLAAGLWMIEAEGRAYLEQMTAKRQRPDMAVLKRLDARRSKCIEQAREHLRGVLGVAAWRRLEAFLDGQFRMRIKRRTLQ